ncbi:Mrp/NBP35 family ATP-binding protein [Blattabacterium cuenoti]|uniref:Mrp/NBP35 family ATP-binding protein n=1 Tax=Blattabacterium cuenoti TaxID=1653831 RepID=UPI00163B9694|nr:Mrp/NBP35 family ATP-binding protein [Blattabacterium cuenoti]
MSDLVSQKQQIIKALETVFIENKKQNIIQSGMVEKIDIDENEIIIFIKLNNPTMHVKQKLKQTIFKTIDIYNNNIKQKVRLEIANKLNYRNNNNKKFTGIKNIIAIASGKGGVGKSIVSTNISVTLANMGFHVGLLDADIYGPSIPILFNIKEKDFYYGIIKKNECTESYIMKPIIKNKVHIQSIGFFSKAGQAIVWRGPMASKALHQLIHETEWGYLDFLIIDLPPGTSDIHLSILQDLSMTGVVMVSTPQKLSLSDVHRSIGMFRINTIYVPIIGIIENMSSFIDNSQPLFEQNTVKEFAIKLDLFFLGKIPMIKKIQEYSDLGIPVVLKNYKVKQIFLQITKNIIRKLDELVE